MTQGTVNPLADTLRLVVENQTALAASIEELALWVRENGSPIVNQRVRDCLATLDRNARVIDDGIAALTRV